MRTQILSIFFIWILSISLTFGQGWEEVFGSGIYSCSKNVYPTSNGYYLIEGSDVNSTTFTLDNYIRMLNASGDLIWERRSPNEGSLTKGILDFGDGTFAHREFIEVTINGMQYRKAQIVKFDQQGKTLWTYTLAPTTEEDTQIEAFFVNELAGITFFDRLQPDFIYISKLDAEGNLIFNTATEVETDAYTISFRPNNYLFPKVTQSDTLISIEVFQTDLDGQLTSTQTYNEVHKGGAGKIISLENGDWILVSPQVNSAQLDQVYINGLDGTVTTDTILNAANPFSVTIDVQLTPDGLIYVNTVIGTESILMIKTDYDGNVLWTKLHDHRIEDVFPQAIAPTLNGGYIVVGEYGTVNISSYAFTTDSLGNIYPNNLTGRVALDTIENCIITPDEVALDHWIITSEKNGTTFITTTDETGGYTLPADTGAYILTVHKPSEYWGTCQNDIVVEFLNTDTFAQIDFPITIETACPVIALSNVIPSIRPCFTRPSYVNYCNYGTVVADSAYIEITYDSLITVVGSSIDYDSLGDQVYRFDLGDLEPLECGSFTVDLFLDCEATVGASYCVEAHAFPDSLCGNPSPDWSGAFIEVSAACESDSVRFRIENSGSGNMLEFSNYIIVEDVILRKRDSVSFESGGFEAVPFPANGSTYAIVAEQVEDAPGFSFPVAFIEGCATNDEDEFSIGFSQQFPLNDANPFLDIDCPVAISSFDPNDKQGFPVGYGDEHIIQPETPIEYLIRFQNTGTDTAFTVIIRDTLDPQLDIATFRPGASSHEYDYSINGEGDLVFNFQNIMLPDSNVNEAASNGFVAYRIRPKASAPLGTVLKNRAAIYFDFNDPIITNETFHTIGDLFVDVMVGIIQHPTRSNISIVVRPNPFNGRAEIDIQNHSADSYFLQIFDLNGKLVRQQQCTESPITIYKDNLTSGLYFYRLSAEDGFLNTGKLIVHQ